MNGRVEDLRRRADANFCEMFRILARGAGGGAAVRERTDGCLIATSVPVPLFNPVFVTDSGAFADLVAEARDFYAGRRLPWALVLPDHDPKAPSRQALRALGLFEMLIMPVYAHATRPGAAWPPDRDDAPVIRSGESGLGGSLVADHRALLAAAFGITPEMSRIVLPDDPPPTRTPGLRLYVAYKDGAPVGSAALCAAEGVAGIYNVAAHPQHRRQGIATALMRRVLADARACGLETAILQSSPAGQALYARLGFGRLATYTIYRPGGG